ncbi:MAG: PAS domain-containing protein [Aureispira sp.]
MDGNTTRKNNTDWKNQELLVEQIFELSPDCMLILSVTNQTFVHVNQHTCDLFGYSKEEFITLPLERLFNSFTEFEELQAINAKNAIGATTELEVMGKRATGSIIFMRLRYSKIDAEQALLVIRDISEQERIALLNRELSEIVELQEQYNYKIQIGRQVLKMVAKQQPLVKILDVLCNGIERLFKGIRVSIFVAREGRLHFASAPSLPESFVTQMNGTPIGANSLPCGVAIHTKEEVLIEDLKNSKDFSQCQGVAEQYNIRSCWSIPIFSSSGNDVLGSFAFYSEEVVNLNFSISDLIAMATDLAAVAIEQDNNRISLIAINKQYANQNQELQAAKQQLERDKNVLLDREEKLKEAQRLSKVGSWELDLMTNHLTWSKQQYLTYGLEGVAEDQLFLAYQNCIHLDDIDNITNAITEIEYPNTTFKYEHRLIDAGSELHYILGVGRVEYNEKKEVILIKGTEQDVTMLKLAEQRALQNELQFNELIANINEIIFIVHIKDATNYDNPIIYINGDTSNIFGYSHQDLIADVLLWPNSIHPEDQAHVIEKGKELHQTEQKVTREYRFKHKEGHYVWIEDNISVGNSEEDGGRRIYGSARDISLRKASEAASLEIQERLELAKEAANLGNYDWKVREDDLHWDDRMHEIYGLEKQHEVNDKNTYIASILHPDDQSRVMEAYMSNLDPDSRVSHFNNAYRIVLDGKIKYIESYVIFMRNEEGQIRRIIGACLDVTERKEAEDLLISNEEKGVLLKEIHHRVKNNLQVITSLLSLQSNFLEDDKQRKIFADSQYRINSMAIVHELLYQSDNLSKLDYKDYLEQLSQYLISSIKGENNNIKLRLDVANIKLSIDTAIPLGLLINEVLTNSLKYGIKGDKAGCISICIFKAIEEKTIQPSFILEIGDDGVGYPDTVNYKNSKSLGLKLIHNLTRQLEGTVRKDLEKKGTNYIIAFKEI